MPGTLSGTLIVKNDCYSSENIRMVCLMKKLDYKWLGPYVIEWVISHSACWLKLPTSFSKIHPVFSVTLLCPFEGDSIPKRQECHPPLPPPIIHNGIEEYEVEKIPDSWILHGKIEYLVLMLGKFGLVRFRAIFARPETRPSGP